jgi:hypothetical protein
MNDPISDGNKYLMFSMSGGDEYYLGCGDDNQCSMLAIGAAQEHDGWTVHHPNDTVDSWGFRIRDDTWALDVDTSNDHAFAPDATGLDSQVWVLYKRDDGTYRLNNWLYNRTLDIANGTTPYLNATSDEDQSGQHWYFSKHLPDSNTSCFGMKYQ